VKPDLIDVVIAATFALASICLTVASVAAFVRTYLRYL